MFTDSRRVKCGVGKASRAGAPLAIALAAAVAGCDVMEPAEPGNLVPATVMEDPALPAVELNGSRFHLETFGDPADPVIIFLHGGPGGDYRGMLRMAARLGGYSLADEYFLVFWDQRGAGLSQRHDRDVLTLTQYRADLAAVADRYSPDRPVFLVGVSWGGMYATDFISSYPERVAGAVLIEPGPLDGVTMERLKNDIVDFNIRAEWLNDAVWSSQFISPDGHARMDYDRMVGVRDAQPRFHQSLTDPEPGWRAGAAASRYLPKSVQDRHGRFAYDFTTGLASFTTPVLFITGSLSEVLGASLQQVQLQRFPAAALEVVDGAGHDVAWVRAPQVVAHIRSYLDERNGGN